VQLLFGLVIPRAEASWLAAERAARNYMKRARLLIACTRMGPGWWVCVISAPHPLDRTWLTRVAAAGMTRGVAIDRARGELRELAVRCALDTEAAGRHLALERAEAA
jgi:hypothetical protein